MFHGYVFNLRFRRVFTLGWKVLRIVLARWLVYSLMFDSKYCVPVIYAVHADKE